MGTVLDNIQGPFYRDTESVTEKIPSRFGVIRVKRCGMQASVLNVRAHRAISDDGGTTNPTGSKAA